jgi:hypothetical protein
MKSQRTKRVLFALGLCAAVAFLGILWLAFLVSRDPGFDWENPNAVEAREAARKLKLFDTSLAAGSIGWVRLSQLEINSYLLSVTNKPSEDEPKAHLRRVGVGLGNTNITLYSWAETSFLKLPLKFVLQRDFHIVQQGTNFWNMPADSVKIGDLEIPRRFWRRLGPIAHDLDAPLVDRLRWATNIPALLVTKNELSQRPELRLYTYKPIPSSDLR